MIEIHRIERSIKNRKFLKSFFSTEEIKEFEKRKFKVDSIAAAFCAKEAFSKAMGTGLRGFSLKDVQLLHNSLGMPYILLDGNAKELFSSLIDEMSVSLTHTESYACAAVVCMKKF